LEEEIKKSETTKKRIENDINEATAQLAELEAQY